jgi:LytS/YehU family sensor histidine kinase
LLRTSLDMAANHEVALEAEVRLARGYAAVMAERFADRVRIQWRVDEAALPCMVPVMCLQPLLENVFKHTVERRRLLTGITVSAAVRDGVLCLAVEDDGGQLDEAATPGIGVANLRERLAALHGQRGSLSLTQLAPAGVRAELRLPCAC